MTVIVGAQASVSWVGGVESPAALAVTLPDGTVLDPAPTVTVTSGTATAPFTTTQAGRHVLLWSSGTARHADVVDVWPAVPHFLISVQDALDAVGSGGTSPASLRDDMPLFIAAATFVLEDICGPLVPTQRTARFDGGRAAIVLPATPVTVQSVTVDGTLLDVAAYVPDEAAGIIYGFTAPGRQNVEVVYSVGDAVVPQNLRLACREQLRFMFQTTRVGTGRGAQELGYTPSGYAVPYMVQGLCAASPAPAPGFA